MNHEYSEGTPSGVRRIEGTSNWVRIEPQTEYEQVVHMLRVMRAHAKSLESLEVEITRHVNDGTITEDEAEALKEQISPEPKS